MGRQERTAVLTVGDWSTEVALPYRFEATRFFVVDRDDETVTWGAPLHLQLEVDLITDPEGGAHWEVLRVSAEAFRGPTLRMSAVEGDAMPPHREFDWTSPDPSNQAAFDHMLSGDVPRRLGTKDADLLSATITPDGLGTLIQSHAGRLAARQAAAAGVTPTQADYLRERARAGSKRATRTDADFRQIAELVRGRPVGSTPALAVQQGLPCSRARAYQLLKEAAELGYLEEVEITGRKNDA